MKNRTRSTAATASGTRTQLRAVVLSGVLLLCMIQSSVATTTDPGTTTDEVTSTMPDVTTVEEDTTSEMQDSTTEAAAMTTTAESEQTTEVATTMASTMSCYSCEDCEESQAAGDPTCSTTGACWMSYNGTSGNVTRFCATSAERPCDDDSVTENGDYCEVCCASENCNSVAVTSCEDLADFLEDDDNTAGRQATVMTSLVVCSVLVAIILY